MNRTSPLLSLALLTLAACAPVATRASVSSGTVFRPGGQDLARICAGHGRVAAGGDLVWEDGAAHERRPAPYLVSCYDFTLTNDGATLSVQDDTLQKALTHFDPSAAFLTYAPEHSLTLPESGLISGDAPASGTAPLSAAVRGVKVSVLQPGTPDRTLLRGGQLTPLRYDPALPLTVRVQGGRVAWPEVTVEANKGRITAPVYRP